MSLFEKYGGIETVEAMVRDFYKEILDDDGLSPFFQGIRMERLIGHQVDLFCYVLGGPCSFKMERLVAGHEKLNITQAHFDAVAAILVETLKDYRVEEEDIETIMNTVTSTADSIVRA